ncbi:MAG: hypothetical protein HY913_06380 [Desulfomonile tiedjei]|nr:hypothetical protein [Desulfomonile tiedjei]
MVDGVMNKLVVPAVLILVLSSLFSAPAFSETKFARINAQVSDIADDQRTGLIEENALPDWLEELLTRVPEEDKSEVLQTGRQDSPEPLALDQEVKTESLERELEESFTPVTVETNQPQDPFFPKPPNMPPLYTSPKLDGEGIWSDEDTPRGWDGRPLLYKTVYRPSEEYPTAVAYMAVFDMKRMKTRLFIGQTEPGVYQISHTPREENQSKIVAITNAMWMQQHARGAGAIFRGQVIYPMVPEMATMVVYRDDSVDIIEWTSDIPLSLVKDARQLRHLIVKDGKVVEQVVKHGKINDSEIGLGGFLIDSGGRSTMGNKMWFLANRTAFGIRDDGNLVFAMGHHISTKDLAKALVLAGCKRAIHGDANIHNIVCNFYFRDQNDKVVKRDRLSPEQLQYTMKRYDQGYSKDFFAFYEK